MKLYQTLGRERPASHPLERSRRRSPLTFAILCLLSLFTQVLRSQDLYGWGMNVFGQLGDGTNTNRSLPVAVNMTGALAGKVITAISTGDGSGEQGHTLALTSTGELYAWGGNQFGQLGDGTTTSRTTAVAVNMTGALAGKTVTAVATGNQFTLALTSEGKVYGWGRNDGGQLGIGNTVNQSSPAAVDMTGVLSGKFVTAVAASSGDPGHSLALTSEGKIYAWGSNTNGKLGDGTATTRLTPVAVNTSGALAGKTVTAVTAGGGHSAALTTEGFVYAWGAGSLGDGTSSTRLTPVAVERSGVLAGKTVTAISAGVYNGDTIALTSEGKVYAWGSANFLGYYGDGTTNSGVSPVAVNMSGVLAGKTVTAINGHGIHCVALTTEGKVYTWGWDGYGQLGIGGSGTATSPVAVNTTGVLAGKTVTSITGAVHQTIVITAPSDAPEIAVKQAGNDIASGGLFTFPNVEAADISTKEFDIVNTGTGSLNLTGTPKVALSGANAEDFDVIAQPTSPVTGPSAPTAFTVVFSPTSEGTKTATLTIANNDSDEGSFVVNISGVATRIPQVVDLVNPGTVTAGTAPFALSATGGASANPIVFSVVSGPATVSGNTLTLTGHGSVTISATQAGNTNYAAGSDEETFSVVQLAQAITFANPGAHTFGDAPFALNATGGASGNPVVFSIVSGPASVLGNTVTITGAGDVTVRASQAGNVTYSAAADVEQTFTVAKAAQSITFTAPATAGSGDTVTLSATGGASGNAVTFSVISGPGSVAGNSLTFSSAGTVVVRASQAASANYAAAADVEATVNVVVNSAPVAVDDALTITTGDATVYPLANDTDSDGDILTIIAVSEPTVVIDGRALVVPAGYTGTFNYTVSDGISSDSADVVVTQGTAVVGAKRYTGLLYSNTGKIVGRATMSRSASALNVFNVRIGSGTGITVFTGTSGLARTTALGPVDVTLGLDNRVTVSMAGGVSGSLRPSVNSAILTTHHVGLASVNAAIPGAGWGRVKVTAIGLARFSLKMPDGKGFLATAEVSDNGSINFYGRQNLTMPAGFIGGEFILANLAKTDLTGEIEWVKPAQATGLHRGGVNTVLVANGCVNTGVFGIPDGPVVVTLSGGNYPAPVVINSTALNGKVAAVLPTLGGWSAQTLGQTFRTTFKHPGFTLATTGTGLFFPKSQTAVGFFPGTTLGGKIELHVP